MKRLWNRFFVAVGAAMLCAPMALAEGTHSGGDVFSLTPGRPSASSGSAKRLSDLVNACTAGRGGSLVGINPGLAQIGTGIGTGGPGLTQFPPTGGTQPPGGGTTPPGGGTGVQALFNSKCMNCHGRNNVQIDPAKAVAFLNGSATPPAAMTAVIAGLSAQERQQLSGFISGGAR